MLVLLAVDVTGDSQKSLDRGIAAVQHGWLRPKIEAGSVGVTGSYRVRTVHD